MNSESVPMSSACMQLHNWGEAPLVRESRKCVCLSVCLCLSHVIGTNAVESNIIIAGFAPSMFYILLVKIALVHDCHFTPETSACLYI